MIRYLLTLIFCFSFLYAKQDIAPPSTLLSPAHSCSFCQKERPGPVKLQASFLIWQSKQWGLEFASKSYATSDPTANEESFRQKLYVPDFSWSPGFKVDFGFAVPRDGWDIDSRWTFYRGDFTNLKKHFYSQIAPNGYGIVPLWHYPFIDISSISNPLLFANASSNWKLFFNSFDMNLGRSFLPMKSMILRMNLGAKGSIVRQHYHVEYSNGTTITGTIIRPPTNQIEYINSRMVFNSHSWGLGPRGGLESKWKFGHGFSLIANTAMSLLSSFFHLNTEFSDHLHNLTLASELNNNLHLKKHTWELIPVFEGTIGIDWGTCFGKTNNPFYLGMTLAYEVQYWWSQNHLLRNFAFQAPGNMWDMRGDLQMHGLTASIESDF